MKTSLLLCLGVLTLLLTGCPRNEYIVEVIPRGNVVDRKLTFYRADGVNSNAVPNYQSFPSNELAAITACYPPGAVADEGNAHRHVVNGSFGPLMPPDIGGAGWYTNLTTSLGTSGFYSERFRGNDDIARMAERRFQAADELTDLVIGWSRVELGRERDYQNLRRFLDVNFRHDLKNLGSYLALAWQSDQLRRLGLSEDQISEEAMVRCGHYLAERGYVKIGNLPDLLRAGAMDDSQGWGRLLQRLVGEKLGIPESAPTPGSLAFLANPDSLVKSWEEYLVTTKFYRAKIRQWEKEKKTDPKRGKPKSSEAAWELFAQVIGSGGSGSPEDHVVVRLSLPSPPVETNGRWDEASRKVQWEADLRGTSNVEDRLPALCYASWSRPDERFQRQHFGRVVLSGADLLRYCLWRGGLNEKQAGEWEALLTGLRSGEEPSAKLDAFRFSDEPGESTLKAGQPNQAPSGFARELIKAALQRKPAAAVE